MWKFWVIAFLWNGVSFYFSWQLRVLGLSYDRVGRVSAIFYLDSVLALLIDTLWLEVDFSRMQVVGLSIIFFSFLVMIL